MITKLAQIGNSKGIRIPKSIMQLLKLKGSVELEVRGEELIVKALTEKPRKNWAKSFEKMHKNKDDQLIIPDSLDLDNQDWEWK